MNHNILSNKKIAEYREAFGIFDKDGDGFITSKVGILSYYPRVGTARLLTYSQDLARVLAVLGERRTEPELEEMFSEVIKCV